MPNAAHLAAADAALRRYDHYRTAGLTHSKAWRGLHARLDGVLPGLYLESPEVAYRVLAAKLSAGYRADRWIHDYRRFPLGSSSVD